ncbi:cation acetate symporter [archaeon SCG-AAA382B04]|nr:cation acetate symporter [archaeon SCG-AAA382B04]
MAALVPLLIVLILVGITLGIAWYSRRWTRTTSEFYIAGQKISWIQNALALTGDYLSAASFLGVAGAIAVLGIDKTWDAMGYFGGYIVLLALLAVPLRKIGKFTAPEILTTRFEESKFLRTGGMLGSVVISGFYVVPQLVGAGALLQLLLGWEYVFAEIVIGALVITYVTLGGMRATTYNQVIQAVVLWGAMLIILLLTAAGYYGLNFGAILAQGEQMIPPQLVANEFSHVIDISAGQISSMTPKNVITYVGERMTGGEAAHALTPGTFAPDWMNVFALAMGLVFGTAGLPHVLKRYYTVDKPKDARTSTIGVLFAIGLFYIMTVFVGIAAMHLLYPDILGYFLSGQASVAKNMAVPLLGRLVGGDTLLGIAIGGAFCAIISTTAGLLITIGTTITHDFYGELINKNPTEKKEVFVAKLSIAATGTLAVLLAILLKNQNVSFLVTLAFGMAASIFFPTLFMSVWWKEYTREGAVATMITGLVVSVIFVAGQLMGTSAILGIPVLVNPALYSLPAAIVAGILVSLVTDDYGEAKKFMALAHRREE